LTIARQFQPTISSLNCHKKVIRFPTTKRNYLVKLLSNSVADSAIQNCRFLVFEASMPEVPQAIESQFYKKAAGIFA
jgi:hypothetical protein